MWHWILAATLLAYPCCATTSPAFVVTFPAVIDAGSEATLCASLVFPNETLRMTVRLKNQDKGRVLFEHKTTTSFFRCLHFQAPVVEVDSLQTIRVEVQGMAFQLVEERKVLFKPVFPITFIQPDKPVYKPGQMVQFRVFTVDTHFIPVNHLYDTVELEDPNGNRIGQWLNVSSGEKIVQLSHPLSSEASVGTYHLAVYAGPQRTDQSFRVMEYVLQKFEVTVNAPPEVNAMETEVDIEVCGKYTYGQPLTGSAQLQLCRHPYEWVQNTPSQCVNQSLQLDKHGCTSGTFNVTFFLNFKVDYQDSLSFDATVEEQGTGTVLPGAASITINYMAGKISFVDTPDTYKSGTNIQGKVQLVNYNNIPMAGKAVYLYKGFWEPSQLLLNLTTDQHGMAEFSLDNEIDAEVQLKVTFYPPLADFPYLPHTVFYQAGMQTVSQVMEDTKPFSFLAVENYDQPLQCGTEVPIHAQYTIIGETAQKNHLNLQYLILSKGAIVLTGSVNFTLPRTETGKVSFMLNVTPELAPVVHVVVFTILPSGKMIAASMDFPTEKCFKHNVSLEFSSTSAVPGQQTNLKIMADPGAMCALTAVDQSVLLLDHSNRLDADKIYSMLPAPDTYTIYAVEDPEDCLQVRSKRFARPQDEWNTLNVFKGVGLKLATNIFVAMPPCVLFKGRKYNYADRPQEPIALANVAMDGAQGVPQSTSVTPLETMRTFFPETWLWDLVNTGTSGSTLVSVTVPDSITTWATDAFCLSESGLGLAPPTMLTAFQPFFLDLTLPYSIIRGERFQLKATVYSYLPNCIAVKVSTLASQDYSLEPCTNCQYSSCLCANEMKTFKWVFQTSVLGIVNVTVRAEAFATTCNSKPVKVPDRGRADTVARTLLVKAEGTHKTDSYSWLLCPNGTSVRQEVVLRPPANIVSGTMHTSVSVLGDVLGRAIQNMEDLLAMPYGCGEQNIAILAPDIYILQYLMSTAQITPTIREKAQSFLQTGYQRQLNYKNSNGSYSIFPGGSENNWLTAFVVRCFAKAQEFIYIDPHNIEDSVNWLLSTQKEDGCFKTVGKIVHTGMKGGVESDATLTSYVTIALLESQISTPALNHSLTCLRSDTTYLTNTYIAALMAYTFSLAGDQQKRAELMAHLRGLASANGVFPYWSQSSSHTSDPLSVEMTSYVLLAVLSASPLTAADLGYATRIVRWLVKQQNAYGGFYSTQDTVVALQALSLYSTLAKNANGASTVTVQSPSKQKEVFNVNLRNKMLYQERTLKDTKGRFIIIAQGTRCVSVQLNLHYNVPPSADNSTFSVVPSVQSECSNKEILTLNLQVQYNGLRETTNMAVLEITILSGFAPDPSSLTELRESASVERVDVTDDSVVVYLSELQGNTTMSYTLLLVQNLKVGNIKPAIIRMYDYYQPREETTVEYASVCK